MLDPLDVKVFLSRHFSVQNQDEYPIIWVQGHTGSSDYVDIERALMDLGQETISIDRSCTKDVLSLAKRAKEDKKIRVDS